ncbi:MAG: cytochrome b/b6 domain-containing protein [Methyloglobulus sp.]|nr:cytochrome B [Methyloglobulus sp.]
MTTIKKTVQVWSPLIRIGHWTLVIAFFTAYFTEDDFMNLHAWAGYIVGIYLLTRILWGFVGGKYVRFGNFIHSPTKILGYLKNLIARNPQHYIGHNPAGGAMVIALLVSLAGTTLTGIKLYAVEENKGPFAITAQQAQIKIQSASLITEAKAEDDDEDEGSKDLDIDHKADKQADKQAEEFWEELHELFANLTLLLVFLHVGGVIASSIIDKEKLVKAMLTGEKNIDDTYQ